MRIGIEGKNKKATISTRNSCFFIIKVPADRPKSAHREPLICKVISRQAIFKSRNTFRLQYFVICV